MIPDWKQIKSFAKKSVTENKSLKMGALAITLILFFGIRYQEKIERWVDIEVNVIKPLENADVVLTSKIPDTVRVIIKGRSSIVDEIKNGINKPSVTVDLRDRTESESSTYFFEPEMFKFNGVEVITVKPESVNIKIEKVVSRLLPIRAKLSGRLPSGTQMESDPTIIPSTIVVAGATSVMKSMTHLLTEDVNIEDLKVGEHDFFVTLRHNEGLKYKRNDLKIKINVTWTTGRRMLSGLLVRIKGYEADAVEIRPGEVAVSLFGPQVSLDNLDMSVVFPEISVEKDQYKSGSVVRSEIKVMGLPDDIKIKSIVPSTVQVKIIQPIEKPN